MNSTIELTDALLCHITLIIIMRQYANLDLFLLLFIDRNQNKAQYWHQ